MTIGTPPDLKIQILKRRLIDTSQELPCMYIKALKQKLKKKLNYFIKRW